MQRTETQDTTANAVLERLNDPKNYPEDTLYPYREFEVDGNTYYFTPGGFLYRNDPGTEEIGRYFCGYLPDEVWHYRIDDG